MRVWQSTVTAALAGTFLFLSSLPAVSQQSAAPNLTPQEAQQIAVDAYIYGYSLITTDVTRIQQSNVAQVEPLAAPLGSFKLMRSYPPATFRGVSATNADTLYSVAWLDLSEPQVVSHPDMGDRFYLFQLVDLWMVNKQNIGTRATGQKAASYLFTGPGWSGSVPAGLVQMKFPTRYVVVLGRTYAQDTPQDMAAAYALMSQYTIVPLSSYGKPYTFKAQPVDPNPGFSQTEAPQKAILALGTTRYFNLMSTLIAQDAPAPAEDAPILAEIAKLGIVPGKQFDPTKLPPDVQSALAQVPQLALQRMNQKFATLGRNENGWRVTNTGGQYGTDYLSRGAWAANYWPSNLPEDAVYPFSDTDNTGQPLNGTHNYTLTFAKGQTPPVNPKAFWSITMYIIDNGYWFFPNPLNKLTVSPRNNLQYNPDGSLTIYLQHDSPGAAKEANWLPAPSGPFALTLRMYWSNTTPPSILDFSWKPPAVTRTN